MKAGVAYDPATNSALDFFFFSVLFHSLVWFKKRDFGFSDEGDDSITRITLYRRKKTLSDLGDLDKAQVKGFELCE